MKTDKIYAFEYCSCIHESAFTVVSLHFTPEGAEKAMNDHKKECLDEFNKMWEDDPDKDEIVFGEHEDWRVEEYTVLP